MLVNVVRGTHGLRYDKGYRDGYDVAPNSEELKKCYDMFDGG